MGMMADTIRATMPEASAKEARYFFSKRRRYDGVAPVVVTTASKLGREKWLESLDNRMIRRSLGVL
jgi:hypothetical protein